MEKKELFRIGEVSKMFHLSVGLLRHYEKIGLLLPEYVDDASGYRYYSTRQFECLNTIRYLRALDMPLEEISDFLKNRDIDKIRSMLWRQKEAVRCKQRELKIIEKKIDNRLAQLQDALGSELDTVRIITSEPRRIALLRDSVSPGTYLDLETSIRQLEKGQKDTSVFLGKIGVGIAGDKLRMAMFEQYDTVFLILDDEDPFEGNTEILPREKCVSIRFCGSHKDAPEYYRKLCTYISEHGLAISGFSKEITLIDDGLTSDAGRFVTEIQIPVVPDAISTQ